MFYIEKLNKNTFIRLCLHAQYPTFFEYTKNANGNVTFSGVIPELLVIFSEFFNLT